MSKHKTSIPSKSRESARPHPSFVTPALHCFLITARLGSVRAAADQLNLAPSAVSRQIGKLEAALGTALFERLPRGLRLSSAGELFLYHVRESTKQIDRARSLLNDMQGLKRGHVSIATTESIATGFLPPFIADFWKQYPDITISINATRSSTAFAGVADGQYDFAIGFDMHAGLPLNLLASARLVIGAWIPKGHKLAKARTVKLADLVTSRLLLPDETIRLRGLLNPLLRRKGEVEPRLVSNSTTVLESFAALGCGTSIFTKIGTTKTASGGNTVFRPIQELSRHSQTLQFCSRTASLSPSGSVLAKHLTGPIRALSDF